MLPSPSYIQLHKPEYTCTVCNTYYRKLFYFNTAVTPIFFSSFCTIFFKFVVTLIVLCMN